MRKDIFRKLIIVLVGYVAFAASFEIGINAYYKDKVLASLFKIPAPAERQITVRLLVVTAGNKKLEIETETIFAWLEEFDRDFYQRKEKRLNPEKAAKFLLGLAPNFKTLPINAVLEFDGKNIKEASLAQIGQELNIEDSVRGILRALIKRENKTELELKDIEPEITLNKVKALGIETLLAKGESDYEGSPSSRIFNIKYGSAKYNGIIIRPDEEFSFNSHLGEVDEKSGFLPELVIIGNKIRPEYGGGICQISTTLFRAAVFAGLPIIERRPHSLPVRYYNPQGFDATVYPGSVDLRFKNDTDAPILIQNKIVGTKLTFELYGAKTEKQVTVSGPYNTTFEDGSVKASLTREIKTASGETKKETFYSSYKSPSLFIRERNPLE